MTRNRIIRLMILIIIDIAIIISADIILFILRFIIFDMDKVYPDAVVRCIPVDIVIVIAVLSVFKWAVLFILLVGSRVSVRLIWQLKGKYYRKTRQGYNYLR